MRKKRHWSAPAKPPRDHNDFCIYAILLVTVVVAKEFGVRNEFVVFLLECGGHWGKGKLWWHLRGDRVESECECLDLMRQGRWANNVFQLLQATLMAKVAQIDKIYVPDDFMMLKDGFVTDNGIHILMSRPPPGLKCLRAKFYFHFPGMPPLNSSNVHWFREKYMKQFPNISLGNDVLVMHVRSGDIFTLKRKWAFLNYEQPPCKYYKDVMGWKKWSSVLVLAQDRANPCVDDLVKRGALYRRRSVMEDLTLMLNAKALVASKGTFGMAVALLSYHLRELYTFNMDGLWMGDHWNCDPTELYKAEMINKWRQTRRQRQIMAGGESCSKWTFLRREVDSDWLVRGQWAP